MSKRIQWLLIVVALSVGGTIEIARSQNQTAKHSPSPVASPTPIDQHWKVEYGEIEMLEEKLHTLNAARQMVDGTEIHLSADGKRFVILVCDADEQEEDEE